MLKGVYREEDRKSYRDNEGKGGYKGDRTLQNVLSQVSLLF